jgi:mercuric ion binding protein
MKNWIFAMLLSTLALPVFGEELTVNVKGMVCAFCAQGIEKKLTSQDEVESVEVSLQNKFVKIKFKEGKRLANDKIITILKESGYDTDLAKE